MIEKAPEVILASASPRRRSLMGKLFGDFRVAVPEVDERVAAGPEPAFVAEELAKRKAEAVASGAANALVVGADTITVLGDEIMGKPRSPRHAREMLHRLSGTKHSVITGVCLILTEPRMEKVGHEETAITMRELNETEIDDYVESGEAMGKAGAYAIQEKGDRFVAGYSGSFSNIVGLPLRLVRKLAREIEGEAGIHLPMTEEASAS